MIDPNPELAVRHATASHPGAGAVPGAPAPVDLGDGLELRGARPGDREALVDFHTRVFDGRITAWTGDLMSGRHPTVQPADFTIVEDTRSGKIVSSAGLISQRWAYEGIEFGVGRPELVATDPDYRRRGLVGEQFRAIHARSAAKGEHLQVIAGLEWFYRQFGYEMAPGMWGSRCIDALHLPEPGGAGGCVLRPADGTDHAFIREVYDHAMSGQRFAALRSPEEWEYEFTGRSRDNTRGRSWLVLVNGGGERLGYVQYLPCLPSPEWPMFRIYQVELKSGESWLNLMPVILRELWTRALAMVETGELPNPGLSGLELSLERDHPAYRALPGNLLRSLRPTPWYVRVPDMAAFLNRIRPALEKHLPGTPAEGHTGELRISFIREGLRLEFARGRVSRIERWIPGALGDGDACFPDAGFLQLVCGWRRVGELGATFADCRASHEASVLLDCLFPACHGKIWLLA